MTVEWNGTAGIREVLAAEPDVIFAVLIGSRAEGRARLSSDWDVAVRWSFNLTPMQRIEKTETLRRKLAAALDIPDTMLDLVDLFNATLTPRSTITSENQADGQVRQDLVAGHRVTVGSSLLRNLTASHATD